MFKTGYPDTNDDGRLVAAFDLDHTLIKPRGNHKFSKDADDWQWMSFLQDDDTSWTTLEALRFISHEKKHQIVVFTNQKGEKNDARQKIKNIVKELKRNNIIITVYASTEDDFFRKPRLGMYEQFKRDFPSAGHMYYCGDAAGRETDFSSSDYAFAVNISSNYTSQLTWKEYMNQQDTMRNIIDFIPPEELFQIIRRSNKRICNRQQPLFTTWSGVQDWRTIEMPKITWKRTIPDFDVIEQIEDTVNLETILDAIAGTIVDDSSRENGILIVLMMGSPASGKTTCAKAICEEFKDDFADGVILVSKDDYPTPAKSFKKFKEHISKGQSVVIDGCHATQESRKKYMDVILKTEKVNWFVINARTDKPTSMLLNQRRAWDARSEPIPDVGIHTWYKKYEDPELDPWIDTHHPVYNYNFEIKPSMRVY